MDFYNNLTDSGIFFFWVVVFLVLFLLILSIMLVSKNKKLKRLVENKVNVTVDDSTLPISDVMEKEEVKEDLTEEIIEIEDKKETIIPLEVEIKEDNKDVAEEIKVEIKEDKPKTNVNTSGVYQRNVLREMSRKMPISPIHIERSRVDDNVNIYTVSSEDDDYGFDEVFLREDSVSPLEQMEDSYEANDGMKFASEIVSKMEEEIVPSNIELNDFEKKQEEEAIISYSELEKVKDRIYNLTLEEEDDEFIDELKNFRSDL